MDTPALSLGVKRSYDGLPIHQELTPDSTKMLNMPADVQNSDRAASPAPSTATSTLSEVSTMSTPNLQPATSSEPAAKKQKLTFAEREVEKAVKKAEKEKKARLKEEEKRVKDEERRRKAEEKEADKAKKDVEKAEKEAARAKKDAEKAEKKKVKDAEKAEKEAEQAKKQAERLKKERVRSQYRSLPFNADMSRHKCVLARSSTDPLQLQHLLQRLTMSLVEYLADVLPLPRLT
jgi:chromatin assembly factor 1 subunit A